MAPFYLSLFNGKHTHVWQDNEQITAATHYEVPRIVVHLKIATRTYIIQTNRGLCNKNELIQRACYAIIVNEYDQEIPQSQTADNPMAPRGRAT